MTQNSFTRCAAALRAIACAAALAGICACVLVASGPAVTHNSEWTPSAAQLGDARSEIITAMDNSASAWNRGDLNGFLNAYDPGSGTTFVGRNGVLRGRDAIRATYTKSYAAQFAPGGRRDSLSFENVQIDLLAPDVANVIAYYRLTRGDSTTGHGPTSLVMRHAGANWLIIHDHSS